MTEPAHGLGASGSGIAGLTGSERLGCARLSVAAHEDLAGTASTVGRWLLVEQPGPWGPDALRESGLDGRVAEDLALLGRRLRMRVLLIRRHGRHREPARRRAFAAVTGRPHRRLERVLFDDPAELLEWDWGALMEGGSAGGQLVDDPLFLVCTNGRHDACCAELGRPLAATLSSHEPTATWESSHFGGDRFAGNVVCLPEGLYYGRLAPSDAGVLAAAHRRGELWLPHLRGRSSLPFAVQAAEIALRRADQLHGIDDLVLDSHERLGADRARVAFRTPTGRVRLVEVSTHHDADPRMLSCGATPAFPPRFETTVL